MIRIAALTNRTLRELPEMQYQFDEPFIVDSNKIGNTLGVRATPVEKALADTLATYRSASTGSQPAAQPPAPYVAADARCTCSSAVAVDGNG